uniref:Cytochrome c oxidase subunit 2 n=1 Tax=Reduvius tenebrosus TaxID=1347737 RepID=A0A342CF75_9HEMI|nr:cytochrome c oxidase subunit II [Reduvius tenebrosus]AGO28015.1 cytochrome c oxidase subunit II [Reduvius tenebrosus]
MASWSTLSLQDANSPIMENATFFHDHSMMILSMITIVVLYMIGATILNKYINRDLLEGQALELIWTALPAITLIFIALPSIRLLYMMDEVKTPMVTIKAMGHQWYWKYEYSDFEDIEFESYMTPVSDLTQSQPRLLEVDNRTVLPFKSQIRLLCSASDVLHSWAIPSLGVKVDATPGRLNQTGFFINRPGVMYGQCSEICGANHSFMPIVIESVSANQFISWLSSFK